MIERCMENNIDRDCYFDRGITVCDEWLGSFKAFEKWALENGYEKSLNIDRIDNNKGYSSDNCRFVTPRINQNNKRDTLYIEYNGEKKPICIVLYDIGKRADYATIFGRIKRGWDAQTAIDTPIKKGNYNNRWIKVNRN